MLCLCRTRVVNISSFPILTACVLKDWGSSLNSNGSRVRLPTFLAISGLLVMCCVVLCRVVLCCVVLCCVVLCCVCVCVTGCVGSNSVGQGWARCLCSRDQAVVAAVSWWTVACRRGQALKVFACSLLWGLGPWEFSGRLAGPAS